MSYITKKIISFIGLLGSAIIGVILRKVFQVWGIFDPFSEWLGDWLKMHVTPGQVEWTIAGILAVAAYAALLWIVWKRQPISGAILSHGIYQLQQDMEVSEAESGHLISAFPATAPIVQNMPLSNEQKKQLIKSVIALRPIIKSIMINRSSNTRNTLWMELIEVFNRAGFGGVDGGSVQSGFQSSANQDETGVMICTIDPNSPSNIDALIKDALEKIGIESKYIPLSEAQYKGDITIFVGPDPL